MKKRTKFTIVAIVNLTWFTIAVLIISALDKEVPDSLITCWYAAWTAELAMLCGIKIKDKRE